MTKDEQFEKAMAHLRLMYKDEAIRALVIKGDPFNNVSCSFGRVSSYVGRCAWLTKDADNCGNTDDYCVYRLIRASYKWYTGSDPLIYKKIQELFLSGDLGLPGIEIEIL